MRVLHVKTPRSRSHAPELGVDLYPGAIPEVESVRFIEPPLCALVDQFDFIVPHLIQSDTRIEPLAEYFKNVFLAGGKRAARIDRVITGLAGRVVEDPFDNRGEAHGDRVRGTR